MNKIIIIGSKRSGKTQKLIEYCKQHYIPFDIVESEELKTSLKNNCSDIPIEPGVIGCCGINYDDHFPPIHGRVFLPNEKKITTYELAEKGCPIEIRSLIDEKKCLETILIERFIPSVQLSHNFEKSKSKFHN